MSTPPPPPPPPPPRRFVPHRPGGGMISLFILTSLAGGLVLLSVVGGSFAASSSLVPALMSIVLALVPLPALIGLVLLLDRLEPEPLPELTLAFLWGAGGAVLLAGIANGVGYDLLTATAAGATDYLTATVVAPVTEELLKGGLLLGYLRFRRHTLDSVTDGIVYAAVVALGFATTENITYYLDAALSDTGALAATFVIRGLIAPLGHPLYTAMTGIGVGLAATRRGRGWAPVVGLFLAMGLHGLWNGMVGLGELTGNESDSFAGLLIAYAILFVVLVGLGIVLIRDRRLLARQLRDHLATYVTAGALSPVELDGLTSMSGRRAVRRQLKATRGSVGVKAAKRFQHAATDLALLHRRVAADGRPGPDAEAERQHLLTELSDARRVVALPR